MKKIFITLFILAISQNSFAQNIEKFIISEIFTQDSISKINIDDFRVNKNNIFEDDTYVVSMSCSGEFGGTIKFTNKTTGIIYCAASTCPIIVNKLNGIYYVTNSMSHMFGSTDIIEIIDPSLMDVYKSPKYNKGEPRYVGDNESKSLKGAKTIIDSSGVCTIISFPYHEQLYHIVRDFNKTYLTKVIDGKFTTIDTIINFPIYPIIDEVIIDKNSHYIVYFRNNETFGYLDIFENKINIVRQR